MVTISQLILGETGCVSYIVESNKEAAIVDSFQGFEETIEEELEKLQNPKICCTKKEDRGNYNFVLIILNLQR